MSYDNDSQQPNRCVEVYSLLQPFVDGELGDEEHERVLEHLEDCRDCNHLVREQQAVRGLLRQMERTVAPAALRSRVMAALDEVDAELAQNNGLAGEETHSAPSSAGDQSQDLPFAARLGEQGTQRLAAAKLPAPALKKASDAQGESPAQDRDEVQAEAKVIPLTQKLRERFSDLSKGALIMLPAAAAAALMWVAIDRPQGEKPPLPQASGLQSIWSSDQDQPVIPPILGPTRLPEGVEFVSARPNQVRYRHASGLEFIDQRHELPSVGQNRAKFIEDHGLRYRVLHDEYGRPQIEFVVGGAARRLTAVPFDTTSPRARAANADPELNVLLKLARALSKAQ